MSHRWKASADQGAHDRGNSKHHAEQALERRAAMEGDHGIMISMQPEKIPAEADRRWLGPR